MLRPLAETGDEFDGQQIEKAAHIAAETVFGFAELTATMVNDQFADLEAARRRQHRDETMQFAVKPHFLKHFATVTLHATIVIVQTDAG